MEAKNKEYWVCAEETPVIQAIERILCKLYGWSKAARVDAATLILLYHKEEGVPSTDVLRLFRALLSNERGRLLFVNPTIPHGLANESDRSWVYTMSLSSCDIPDLISWLANSENSIPEPLSIPGPDQSLELLARALSGGDRCDVDAKEQVKSYLERNWPGAWPESFTDEDPLTLHYNLLRVSHDGADKQHEERKFADSRAILTEYKSKNGENLWEGHKKKRFREVCEDLTRSVTSRLMPPSDDRNIILLIDDNPKKYLRVLRAIQENFFEGYEVWICKLDENQSNVQDYLTQYRSVQNTNDIKKSVFSRFPIRRLDENGHLEEFPNTLMKDIIPRVRFILVDQLYRRKGRAGEFLGPPIIRGLSRILRDYLSEPYSEVPLPEIVALSRAEDPEVIQQALRAGARSYLLKSRLLALPSTLAKVQRTVTEPFRNPHRNFRSLYSLPNETIGLLHAVRIPRISFHRKQRNTGDVTATFDAANAQPFVELLQTLPKPDLHVHLGSCMSVEFLVLASFIGLLRHKPKELKYKTGLHEVAKLFKSLRDGTPDLTPIAALLPEIGDTKFTVSNEDWIACLAQQTRGHLDDVLKMSSNAEVKGYEDFRAVLHTGLNIPDFLSADAARKNVLAKSNIDLALFVIRHSEKIDLTWEKSDLVRIYLLTLANHYTLNGAVPTLTNRGRESFNFLNLFSDRAASLSGWDQAWDMARKSLYPSKENRHSNDNSIVRFRKAGWRLGNHFSCSLELNLGRVSQSTEFDPRGPDRERQPIEQELATGLNSKNLMEYLQGCEFSGAEHMQHPVLTHLYAQQAIVDFVRQGVFYTELRCSPDGFVNGPYGYEFTDTARCLVEAFTQAQELVLHAYRSSRLGTGEKSEDSPTTWIGKLLGDRFSYRSLSDLFKREPTDPKNRFFIEKHLPCKISLIFAGKRHKSLREMILEAAAVAVMRHSTDRCTGSARNYVNAEMCHCRVVGFDLCGNEYDNPPELFTKEFSRLSRLHVPLTVHAGENAPASFIEDAILLLQARRIGHGLALAEDRDLMTRIREDRVCIELCPVGNHQTSNFTPADAGITVKEAAARRYPLKEYMKHGIYVTICTDNPIISYTNLVKEYFQASYAYDMKGLSLWDALRIMRMGYVCSFLQLPERQSMMELVEQHIFDFLSDEKTVARLRDLSNR